MKRFDLVQRMSKRELGTFISDVVHACPCAPFPGDAIWCKRFSRCAGCYTVWLCRDISVRWCTNCRWYNGDSGRCRREGGEKHGEILDYNDHCKQWEPAEWWVEQKKTCRTCNHRDDYIGKCLCGDDEIVPPAGDDEPVCPAWEPRKENE